MIQKPSIIKIVLWGGSVLLLSLLLIAQSSSAVVADNNHLPSQTADYKIVFAASWDPPSVPNPHFSPLVGAAHNEDAVFWELGGLATAGIEIMAETGGTSTLRAEIGSNPNANLTITGGSIPNSPNSVEISSTTFDLDYPLVTLVSMIAPSPDWFVGVSGLSLIDENGEWVDELVIELFPYDSGTDDGPDFTSPNADSDPAEAIFRIVDSDLFPAETLGTLTITRLDTPEPTPTPTSTATATPIPTQTPNATPEAPFVPTNFIYLPAIR